MYRLKGNNRGIDNSWCTLYMSIINAEYEETPRRRIVMPDIRVPTMYNHDNESKSKKDTRTRTRECLYDDRDHGRRRKWVVRFIIVYIIL